MMSKGRVLIGQLSLHMSTPGKYLYRWVRWLEVSIPVARVPVFEAIQFYISQNAGHKLDGGKKLSLSLSLYRYRIDIDNHRYDMITLHI